MLFMNEGRVGRVVTTSLIVLVLAVPVALAGPAALAEPDDQNDEDRAKRLATGVAQLRHALGSWKTTTEFLMPDGTAARAVEGTYAFEWVVPDRVLVGRSEIPELDRSSGILFYVREDKEIIEMVSVGADGQLWIMTGPIDGEVRTTPQVTMPDSSSLTLRFTRYAVSANRFESKMELSSDGGKTWSPGNHQVFVRAGSKP